MGFTIGARLDASQTSAEATTEGKGFALGDRTEDHAGNEFVYVQAGAAITQYDTVHVSPAYSANAITGALAVTAGFLGFAQVAFASAEYGWVMARGKPTIRVAGSCAKDVPLFTTDTAGVLDDAVNTASHFVVQSVVLLTTNGSTASSGVAAAPFPIIIQTAAL